MNGEWAECQINPLGRKGKSGGMFYVRLPLDHSSAFPLHTLLEIPRLPLCSPNPLALVSCDLDELPQPTDISQLSGPPLAHQVRPLSLPPPRSE